MKKVCTKCGQEKETVFFPLKHSHGRKILSAKCRDCINALRRDWREGEQAEKENAARRLRRVLDPEWREREEGRRRVSEHPEIGLREAARRTDIRRKLDLLKVERGCYICGGMLPAECLDWDHLPGKEKRFNIGCDGTSYGLEACINEIAKCQVVCSNCHRTLTKQRKLLEDK
jgi:hypothetical protein